jgi:carotenoid cleavage dioxygenase-like enzyme
MDNLRVEGALPGALSGQLLGIGTGSDTDRAATRAVGTHDGVVHSVRVNRGGAISYRSRWIITDAVAQRLGVTRSPGPRHSGPDVAASTIVAFGGTILALGDGSLAYELTPDLDTLRRVDLAGHACGLAAFAKRDRTAGDLHLVAVAPSGDEAHVVVSSRAFTRTSRDLAGRPGPIKDLAITRDRVVFAADGSIGVAPRDGDAHVTWIPTGFDAPHLVHAHDEGADIVLHTITPSLERWTLHPSSASMHQEVVDQRAQRFARTKERSIDAVPRFLWTIGDTAVHRHDLSTSSHVEQSFGFGRPGDLVFVDDPQRPTDADGGWLVGFVHYPAGQGTDLVVLDAADIARPAIATVRIPRQIPPGLRCTWIPSTQ